MVNYRRVVCEVALMVALVALAGAAPTPNCDRDSHYDQRQNGTENYRVNIDGVVIAVAPAESLLAAASEIDLDDLFDLESLSEIQKPKPPASQPAVTAQEPLLQPKPEEKPQDAEPESPAKPAEAPLSDVSMNTEVKGQKKDATSRKQEKAQRLKNRLASFLIPLLRKTRHH